MKAAYSDVPGRLKEERLRIGVSQQSMSRFAGVSQTNYAKAEAGTRRLSYYEVKRLGETSLNLLYVFCGMRCKESLRQNLLSYDISELLHLFHIMVSLVQLQGRGRPSERWRRLTWYAELFRIEEEGNRPDSGGFVMLRRLTGETQMKMAERLGVDVKKLRYLENGDRLPDSEILWRLSREFEISPGVLLKDRNCLAGELGCFLEHFGYAAEGGVLQMLGEFGAMPKAL